MNRVEEQRFKDLESKVEQLKQAMQSLAYSGKQGDQSDIEERINIELRAKAVNLKPDNLKEANEIYLFLKEGKLPKK